MKWSVSVFAGGVLLLGVCLFAHAESGAVDRAAQARLLMDENGVITDSSSGLQWFVGPTDVNWNQAVAFCENLEVAGDGWRMPTVDELLGLYTGKAAWVSHHSMPPEFRGKELGIGWVWSGETEDLGTAKGLLFKNGMVLSNVREYVYGGEGAFAVRAYP